MFKFCYPIIFLFLFKYCSAQNINGTWKGNFGRTLFMDRPLELIIELNINSDSIVTGASHLHYDNNLYEHYKITGKYDKKDSTIYFKEDSIIALKIGILSNNCRGNYTMKLLVCNDTLMRFKGRWKDINRGFLHCPSSDVWMEKRNIKNNKDAARYSKLIDTLLNRKIDIQSLIEINKKEKDSIKVEIYDNATVDGDSVSVYYNDSIIVSKKMISLNPITFSISLNKEHPINKIKLAAESLGLYPPCTAIMIITTKTKRYEVSLSSDFNKNAVAELFLKE